jgi:hypothetical protein
MSPPLCDNTSDELSSYFTVPLTVWLAGVLFLADDDACGALLAGAAFAAANALPPATANATTSTSVPMM